MNRRRTTMKESRGRFPQTSTVLRAMPIKETRRTFFAASLPSQRKKKEEYGFLAFPTCSTVFKISPLGKIGKRERGSHIFVVSHQGGTIIFYGWEGFSLADLKCMGRIELVFKFWPIHCLISNFLKLRPSHYWVKFNLVHWLTLNCCSLELD